MVFNRIKIQYLNIFLLSLFVCAFVGQAQAQPPQISVFPDSTALLIGDNFKIEVVVNTPKGVQVAFQTEDSLFAKLDAEDDYHGIDRKLELVERQTAQFEEGKMRDIFRQTFVVTAWDEGRYVFPAIEAVYAEGNQQKRIASQPLYLDVNFPPLLTGDSTYIAPLKPILEEPKDWSDYLFILWWSLAVLFAFLMVWFVLPMLKTQDEDGKKGIKGLKPEVWAIRRLEKLLKSGYLEKRDYAPFHTEISFIIRKYMEHRFKIPALEVPTSEFMPLVPTAAMEGALYGLLKDVLERADLVKFAKASPLDVANEDAVKAVRELVRAVEQYMKAAEPVEN